MLSPEAFALGLVVAVGVDFRLADELTVFAREGHDVVEHVETDRLTSVGPANVEVAELAQVTQRDVAAYVDGVGADAPVGLVDERVGLGFGASAIGDTRRAPTVLRAVGGHDRDNATTRGFRSTRGAIRPVNFARFHPLRGKSGPPPSA